MKTLSSLVLISLSLTSFDGFSQTNVVISDGAAQAASMAAARSALQSASSNALQTATMTTLDRLALAPGTMSQPGTQFAPGVLPLDALPGCVVPPTGLVAWWRAEGNALDSTGNSHDGTLVNGTGFGNGMVGQGFVLDGVDDSVSVPDASTLDFGAGQNFSIEAWIQPLPSSTYYNVMDIVDKRYSPNWSQDVGYELCLGSGKLAFRMSDSLNNSRVFGPVDPDLRDGNFHHVAVTVTRNSTSGLVLYVDGQPIWAFNPTPDAGDLSNTAPLHIGRSANDTFFSNFKGVIDEVSVYNVALSADQVAAIFSAGAAGKCPPEPPGIVLQPASQRVPVGSDASLNVVASGTPPLSYQWLFNGTNVAGATDSTLTLPAVQLASSGFYSVLVGNAYGTTASDDALLAVYDPACFQPPSSLVAWWPGEGNGFDSLCTNNGTLQGAIGFGTGTVGLGFLLDGVDDSVMVSNGSALNFGAGQDFSIEAWIKPLSSGTYSGVMDIVDKRYSPNWNQDVGYELCLGYGQLAFRMSDSLNNSRVFGLAGPDLRQDGNFHHVAVTVTRNSASGLVLYVDGQPIWTFDPTPDAGDLSNTAPLHIGRSANDTFFSNFKGVIDEVSLYSTALSAAQIQDIYQAGVAGKCAIPADWLVYYFGTNYQNLPYAGVTADADSDGETNLEEWQHGHDPNMIRFSLWVTNQYVTTTAVPVQLHITGGIPSYISLMVNSTNLSWQTFTSTNLSVSTPTDGAYVVTVALRGLPTDAAQTWQSVTVFRDTAPLTLTLTNLGTLSGSRPFLDPAGYTTRALSSLTWTLIDANGNTNSGNGAVVAQSWNLADPFHATNWFRCVDLPLALGTNWISIRGVDWVGSVAVTNFAYIFDTNGDSTPPSLTLLWPQDGSQVSGDTFTVQASTDDDTAAVALQYTDANGMVQAVNGLIERGGNMWVPSVPLAAGTNRFSLVVADAAGNTRTNKFTVVQNSVALTVSPVSQRQMPFCSATVYVTVGAAASAVTVNGLPGNSTDGLNWRVESVPLPPGGTVTLQATAQLTDGTTLKTLLKQERDPIVFTQLFDFKLDYTEVFMATGKVALATETYHTDFHWERGAGGTNLQSQYGSQPGPPVTFSNVTVTVWPPDNGYLPSLSGQQVYLHYEDGQLISSSTTPAGLPSRQWMERSTTAGVLAGDFPVPYSESSGRVIKLFTGGRALRMRQGLFDLSASLTCESEVIPEPSQWAQMDGSSPFLQPANPPVVVPPEQVTMGGEGHLGSDGHLWTAQPDGVEVVIMPQAPPTSYNGQQPGWQKHKLVLTANGTDLDQQAPEFVVGQRVSLEAGWSPPLPEDASTRVGWVYSGDSANVIVPGNGDSSDQYWIDPSTFTDNPTGLWWYSEGRKRIWCDTTNYFSNGQVVTFSPIVGKETSVYRPAIADFIDGPASWVANYLDQDGTLYLQLGDDNNHGDMKFRVDIYSKYAGRADYTQLINRGATNAFQTDTTSGQYWLDTTRFYLTKTFDPDQPYPVRANEVSSRLEFADNPGFQDKWNYLWYTTSIADSFQDYIMFRPDAGNPSDNIYVCLGKVTWSWSASTTYSLLGGWSAPSFSITRPEWPDDSNDFPVWYHRYHYP